MPGLSIIIPTLNEAAHLGALLDDLEGLKKGHTPFEIIVADGGSRDATCKLAEDRGARLIRCAPSRGGQLHRGHMASRGDLLWFLHADSRLAPEALSALSALVGERLWGRFDVHLGAPPAPMGFRVLAWAMNVRSRLTCIATGDQGIFIDRRLLAEAGGVPDQPLMEDISLSLALRRLAPPTCLTVRLCTSRRKWARDGLIRGTWRIFCLRLAYALGAAPEALAKRYYHRPHSRALPDTDSDAE